MKSMRLNSFTCSSRLPSFLNPPHVARIASYSTPDYISNQVLTEDHNPHSELLQLCLHHCRRIKAHNLFDEKPEPVLRALRTSKVIHSKSLKIGVGLNGLLGNAIVDLYVKCGNVDYAQKLFSRLEKKDVFSWNSVLSMYSKHGLFATVVESFVSMWNDGVRPNEFTFAMVLSACSRLLDVNYGRQVHCSVLKMGLGFSSFCQGGLIDMYAKCHDLRDARLVFDGALNMDTVSWTALIAGYVQDGLPEEAVKVFDRMQTVGLVPDQIALVTVINAYVALDRLGDARKLFAQLPNPNIVAWNVMISGHAKRGFALEAISFFLELKRTGLKATRSTIGSVLSAIASLSMLNYGLMVHAQVIKEGLNDNVYVGSALVNMYAKCEKMDAANEVFNSLEERNIVLWNAMLAGFAQNGLPHEVMDLFSYMKRYGPQPDEFTFTSIFSACASLQYLDFGRQLHNVMIKNKFISNLFVANALVDMYAKSGALKDARKQFELMKIHDNVSWNAIIVGYVQEEYNDEAFIMFRRMVSNGALPDEVSLASIVSACANVHELKPGQQCHCLLVKVGLDTSICAGSSLIDMYVKCGVLSAARDVFYSMPSRSVVSVNALIAGYTMNHLEEAIYLFHEMQMVGLKPTEVTFAGLLDGCDGASLLKLGRQVHCEVIKWGFLLGREMVCVSLLCMYMNSQRLSDSETLFSELQYPKSLVLWTAFISGCAQNNHYEKALLFYQHMRSENILPDQATFASVLRACSGLSSLQNGQEIHSLIFHTGFNMDEITCSSLIDMYAKCGDVESSVKVFHEMRCRNSVVSWNSMIVGLAKNGYSEEALEIFREMEQQSIMPDDVTFLGVLSACSHAGRVSEGRKIFDVMVSHYRLQPRVDHLGCMVDILGRWGFLNEAEDFINRLGCKADPMLWSTLLGACRKHGDEVRGRRAAEKLMELKPQSSSPYVLLSSIYAASENWKQADSLRREMKSKGVKKLPGYSWIEPGRSVRGSSYTIQEPNSNTRT
ncbi:pentatricopeptide repeat-containing protein At3g09040, mitochondrial [Cucurbita pepo subsp. pepo]|uniref:pentatricopeptide repeat-containing protein At3g09040, mitochondrial n=1 Tax=Cucurbita pepo subsp. pepo TaxID=3664 RepID=UPI000C9D4927|nr:pentatricopeptide repeat-containing protein At3g09040, mitochondrial [Cucurbita pepo subsp. pepo]